MTVINIKNKTIDEVKEILVKHGKEFSILLSSITFKNEGNVLEEIWGLIKQTKLISEADVDVSKFLKSMEAKYSDKIIYTFNSGASIRFKQEEMDLALKLIEKFSDFSADENMKIVLSWVNIEETPHFIASHHFMAFVLTKLKLFSSVYFDMDCTQLKFVDGETENKFIDIIKKNISTDVDISIYFDVSRGRNYHLNNGITFNNMDDFVELLELLFNDKTIIVDDCNLYEFNKNVEDDKMIRYTDMTDGKMYQGNIEGIMAHIKSNNIKMIKTPISDVHVKLDGSDIDNFYNIIKDMKLIKGLPHDEEYIKDILFTKNENNDTYTLNIELLIFFDDEFDIFERLLEELTKDNKDMRWSDIKLFDTSDIPGISTHSVYDAYLLLNLYNIEKVNIDIEDCVFEFNDPEVNNYLDNEIIKKKLVFSDCTLDDILEDKSDTHWNIEEDCMIVFNEKDEALKFFKLFMDQKISINTDSGYDIFTEIVFHDFITGNNSEDLKVKVVTVLIDFSNDINSIDIDSEIKNKFGEDVIIKKIKIGHVMGDRSEEINDHLKNDIAQYYESSDIVLVDNQCDSIIFLFGLHLATAKLNKYFELYGFSNKLYLYPHVISVNTIPEIQHGLFLTRLF